MLCKARCNGRMANTPWPKTATCPTPDQPRIVCGFNPGLPADDTLLIGRAADTSGKPIATLVNYALHPVTPALDNTLDLTAYSGDARGDRGQHRKCAMPVFAGRERRAGASGGIHRRCGLADKHGRALGFAALGVLEGMLPAGKHLAYAGVVESGAPLATWAIQVRRCRGNLASLIIEQQLLLKDNLPSLDDIESDLKTATDTFMIERLRRRRRLRRIVGDGKTSTQRRVAVAAGQHGDGRKLE